MSEKILDFFFSSPVGLFRWIGMWFIVLAVIAGIIVLLARQ